MRERVLNQVAEHALEQRLIGLDDRRVVVRRRRTSRRALLLEADLPLVHDLAEQRAGRDRREVQREPRLLEPRHLEQILDQREQVLARALSASPSALR